MEARHDDMSSMDGMDGTTSTSMSMMMAVFQTNIATPLYSEAWTPSSTGAYAGTCIFLIVLAVILRALIAVKAIQEQRWLDAELKRRYVVVNGKLPLSEQVSRDSLAKRMVLTENGVEEEVMVVGKKHVHPRPWRMSVDPLRAVVDTLIVGVGYLLMLGVMTMNVGYFMSILGGTFLGSLVLGRFNLWSEH